MVLIIMLISSLLTSSKMIVGFVLYQALMFTSLYKNFFFVLGFGSFIKQV